MLQLLLFVALWAGEIAAAFAFGHFLYLRDWDRALAALATFCACAGVLLVTAP
jgi:hypothetical protein